MEGRFVNEVEGTATETAMECQYSAGGNEKNHGDFAPCSFQLTQFVQNMVD
jgi:hypothetical protein